MLFLCFLNAHKKVEFRGALFGGYSGVYLLMPGVTTGAEAGAKLNIRNNFFIIPTFTVTYRLNLLYDLIQSLDTSLQCKIGGGNERHSGYGIIGGGALIPKLAPTFSGDQSRNGDIAPSLILGGGYEYRKGKVGFVTEVIATVPLKSIVIKEAEMIGHIKTAPRVLFWPTLRITAGVTFYA